MAQRGGFIDDRPARTVKANRVEGAYEDPSGDPSVDEMACQLFGIEYADWEQLGPQAKRIILLILPTFVQKFVKANLHYGPNNANVLGPAGQFADIWRKIGPLRRALWEGVELTREGPDEICLDLIGHCLMTVDMIQQGVDRRGTGPIS